MKPLEGFERAIRDGDKVEAQRALMYLESQSEISTMEYRLLDILAKAVIDCNAEKRNKVNP